MNVNTFTLSIFCEKTQTIELEQEEDKKYINAMVSTLVKVSLSRTYAPFFTHALY